MPFGFPSRPTLRPRVGWQEYQANLQRDNRRQRRRDKLRRFALTLAVPLAAAAALLVVFSPSLFRQPPDAVPSPGKRTEDKPADALKELNKQGVQTLLAGRNLVNLDQPHFSIRNGRGIWQVNTSLNAGLQNYLIQSLNTRTARYIGIVALEPESGRVLAMVGFDKNGPDGNPCTDGSFPAASIFKIVTAAAAVEACGMKADTRLYYNGGKYTLYKNQLKRKTNRYSHRTTLKDSFAQSVNPVFGKIGTHWLGKTHLEHFSTAFGFNRRIAFEVPLTPSRIEITDEPYRLAEIACGFNRATTISALHGALIAASVINEGTLLEPTVIDRIESDDGRSVYVQKKAPLGRALRPETATTVRRMMAATVKSGTGRQVFKGHGRDRVLRNLSIGGKTGSINNRTQDARFDWFVGYAIQKKGRQKLAVAVVVAHEKFIGTRAGQYARMTIRHYFDRPAPAGRSAG